MTVPDLSTSNADPLTIEADILVLGVLKTVDGPRLAHLGTEFADLALQLEAIGVGGDVDELRRVPSSKGATKSVALIGIGPEVNADALRYAAGSAARQLRGIHSIVFALPTASEAELLAILEGAALGAYGYTEYRSSAPSSSSRAPRTEPAGRVIVATELTEQASVVERAHAVASAVHLVRDLVNASPSDLYPESLANRAVAVAAELPIEVTVLADAELRAGGFGGILGVGQGSARPPRLVKLSYQPAGASRHVAMVGKGITFDSGGLSLKPPASMIGMKYDMTGSATVLAAIVAIARLALPVRVTAWLCIAENMPSGSAMRPGDVIRIRGGKTVEVLNTDAEGRLVLADGLVAASEEQPDAIVDVATLTGAALVALGNRYVGTMGDTELVTRTVEAASRVGETFWPMPIPAELRPMLASDIADIANIKPGNTAAGMLIAAAFLKDFIGKRGDGDEATTIPWVHLDIAGPANNGGGGWGFTGKGPTGVAVRALIELAEDFSRP